MIERDESPVPALPRRPADGHKGSFGTLTVIGGCDDADGVMIGAPALAARAAFRAGCGRVRLVMPRSALCAAIILESGATGVPVEQDGGSVVPSAMTARVDECGAVSAAVLVGPGLGVSDAARAATLRALHLDGPIVVLDADALRLMAELSDLTREIRARAILTPHPGEYGLLASALRLPERPTSEAERVEACARLASRLACVVVLKGHRTVVSDGLRAWVCARGGVELATAGTGDVLAGLVASLGAQHAEDGARASLPAAIRARVPADRMRSFSPYDIARVAVEAHARAGESWRAGRGSCAGMLARELADELPPILESMRAGE